MKRAAPLPHLRRELIAILRGVKPSEAGGIAAALFDAGFQAVEIPLNSPDPFRSIETAARLAPAGCIVGAGTVLEPEDVDRLHDCGGRMVVSPNVDPSVIMAAAARDMVSLPGVFTASEALLAVRSGASGLKFFPAMALGPQGIAAIRAVLPAGMPLAAVGGVAETDFAAYGKFGIRAFGLGSSLYRPGATPAEVAIKAQGAIAAWDAAFAAPAA